MCRWLKDYFNSRSYVKNEFEKIQKTYSENLSTKEIKKLYSQLEKLMPILNKEKLEKANKIKSGLLKQIATNISQEIGRRNESDIPLNFQEMMEQYIPKN